MKLSELKKLHDKGFALIYLRPKSKRPFESGWTTANKKTWEELENSFEKSYNIGVRLGTPSKLISGKYLAAIDCDVKSKTRKAHTEMNEALTKLGIDLKTAPIVMSGRGNGSKHIYVQTKEPLVPMKYASSVHKVKVLMPGETHPHSKAEMEKLTEEERKNGYRIRPAWEISFMGTGQQTVLPPSIHPDTGMSYAWASPLTVKNLPTFDPSRFVSQVKKTSDSSTINSRRSIEFETKPVDLSRLPSAIIKIINCGENCEDRSAALMSVILTMCRMGFTDAEILGVLTDPAHWLAGAAYDHAQTKDRSRAAAWLERYTLRKARFDTDIMRRFENPPPRGEPLRVAEVEKLETALNDESDQVLPDRDGNGKPKSTLRNLVQVLEKKFGGGLVGFDEFANRAIFLKDTPYGGIAGHELTDYDDLMLKHHLAERFRFEPSKEVCFEAHTLVAQRYKFHPVRDYLNTLAWDGKARLDRWLGKAFGATGPKDYLIAVGTKMLVAAVKRVMEPGCKFDYAVVLEGNQGEGKSMALRILASSPWFTDRLGDIHQKDVVDQMTGKWVVELSELANVRKAEIDAVKSFITCQIDRVRPPYGRRSMDYPRQSIFVGSTNSSEYFTDETGNRRWWPVAISQIDIEWIERNRHQLWAEAVEKYQEGETVYLSKEIEAVARIEQEKRFEVDEWEAPIKEMFLEKEKNGSEIVMTSTEVWNELNGFTGQSAGGPSQSDARRIGRIMHRLKFKRSTRRFNGVLGKCWIKSE